MANVDLLVNRAGLAKLQGVSPPTIDGWITKSCPVENKASQGRAAAHEAGNARAAPQSPNMKSRQRNGTGYPRNVREATTRKGFAVLPRLKTTIEIDGETAQRVEAERERIAAETGLPKASLASVIAAVLRRGLPASPCDGAKPPMPPHRAR